MRLLWYYYFIQMNRHEANSIHSRNRKNFYKNLSIEQRRLRYMRIPRVALLSPKESPWRKLYASKNDQAFITATGLDVTSFEELLSKFTPFYNNLSPHSENGKIKIIRRKLEGRRRIMNSCDCLGLVLMHTRTRGSSFSLQMKFGISGTATTLYIRFARRILLHIFSTDNDASICIPSNEKIDEYKH
jgi:hypothetical protein